MKISVEIGSGKRLCRFNHYPLPQHRIAKGEPFLLMEIDTPQGIQQIGICKNCANNFYEIIFSTAGQLPPINSINSNRSRFEALDLDGNIDQDT